MNAANLIQQAAADGVRLSLSPTGSLRATGERVAVERWTTAIRAGKQSIMAALRPAANDPSVLDIFAPELVADPDLYQRWIVTVPGRDPFAVIVVPAANAGQMRRVYPSASSIVADQEGGV